MISGSKLPAVSGVVLVDLSAAFDLVDHQLLLQKLEIYGLDRSFLGWITSYLTDRHQAVWIDQIQAETQNKNNS